MEEGEGIKKESKIEKGCCLGCLSVFLVIFLVWFILVERHFIFIRYPIYGTITDRETGKPIENALVVFAWRSSGRGWREYDATITDEKGYYKLPKRWVISYAKEGNIEFIGPPFIEARDGCVLVAWFPGYFRSEKWEKGKRLIKGRQDFTLQKAKTREEVVKSLDENVLVDAGFKRWRSHIPYLYNPQKIDIVKEYWYICKKLDVPEEKLKYGLGFYDYEKYER